MCSKGYEGYLVSLQKIFTAHPLQGKYPMRWFLKGYKLVFFFSHRKDTNKEHKKTKKILTPFFVVSLQKPTKAYSKSTKKILKKKYAFKIFDFNKLVSLQKPTHRIPQPFKTKDITKEFVFIRKA